MIPKMSMEIFDDRVEAQTAVKTEYNRFLEIIAHIDYLYASESQDIKPRINLAKVVAAETSPLPSFRLKELEKIIERTGEKSNTFQADISDNSDKMVRVFRAATVPETDRTLFKDMVNQLQGEKYIRRTKL